MQFYVDPFLWGGGEVGYLILGEYQKLKNSKSSWVEVRYFNTYRWYRVKSRRKENLSNDNQPNDKKVLYLAIGMQELVPLHIFKLTMLYT